MTLQEQNELAADYKAAKAAHEAASQVLGLVSASVKWPEMQAALKHIAALRDAERAAYNAYLGACLNAGQEAASELRATVDELKEFKVSYIVSAPEPSHVEAA